MKKLILLFALMFLCTSTFAQIRIFDEDDDSTEVDCSYQSLDLGYNETGISFGNSPRWSGIRFNFSDCGIQEINGINITFWTPEKNPGSKVRFSDLM